MKRLALLLAVLALPVCAQYSITWSTHDAGGGTSSGGAYTLSGTAGQPDAGYQSGGAYGLIGGFWGAFADAPAEPIPTLRILLNGSKVTLAWQNPSTGFILQESSSLSTPVWTDVLELPGVVGLEKQVSVNLGVGERYFRLRRP